MQSEDRTLLRISQGLLTCFCPKTRWTISWKWSPALDLEILKHLSLSLSPSPTGGPGVRSLSAMSRSTRPLKNFHFCVDFAFHYKFKSRVISTISSRHIYTGYSLPLNTPIPLAADSSMHHRTPCRNEQPRALSPCCPRSTLIAWHNGGGPWRI